MRGKPSSIGAAAARLLPLNAIPVVDQSGGGDGRHAAADALAAHREGLAAAAAAAAKKFGEGIPVDVQAGALVPGLPDSATVALRRGSPMASAGGGGGASLAPRRKAAEAV